MNKETDFHFQDGGTIVNLIPLNDKAEGWIKNNLQFETWQDIECLSIDGRMFHPIFEAIKLDGFCIEKI